MSWKNDIKFSIMFVVAHCVTLYRRLKVYLGILKTKYGIIGYQLNQHGIPLSDLFAEEIHNAASQYDRFREDDVVVATYAKSGTNFTEDIVASIYAEVGLHQRGYKPHVRMEFTFFKAPNKENLLAHVDTIPSPRIISTHLQWDHLPEKVRNGTVRTIHCLRNPKDVVCSGFPFFRKLGVIHPNVTWKEFFQHFLDENIIHGGYFQYVRQWYAHRHQKNLLNLEYEDLKRNLRENVVKIAEFLGQSLTEEQIERVVTENTFENKKKSVGSKHLIYRKGKSGGWRSELTVEQNELMDEKIKSEFEDLEELNLQYD